MFFLKQKFGILPMRAINELDRGSSVSQSGAFSFATELPPSLPWLTRTSPFLPMSTFGHAGIPAAFVVGPGAFLMLAGRVVVLDHYLLWVAPATCLTDQRALQHAAELSLFSSSILHDLVLFGRAATMPCL
jgi:hypothetical protein